MDERASAVQGWVPTAVTGRTEVGIWALVILLNDFVKQRKKIKLLLPKFYCRPFFFARQAICMWWTSKGKWEGSTISEIWKLVEKTVSLLHWQVPNKVPSKCHPELWSEDQDLENNFFFFALFFKNALLSYPSTLWRAAVSYLLSRYRPRGSVRVNTLVASPPLLQPSAPPCLIRVEIANTSQQICTFTSIFAGMKALQYRGH